MNRLQMTGIVLLSLAGMGSSCVNDNASVSLNLKPIVVRFKLGTNTVFAAAVTVKLDSIVGHEFRDRIRQGRVYDLRVKSEGSYAGSVSGVAAIKVGSRDQQQILRFPETGTVPWSAFHTPQSLLSNSSYLSAKPEGISELLSALTFQPLPDITLSVLGVLNVAPVPDNLYVTLEVYLQADAEIN